MRFPFNFYAAGAAAAFVITFASFPLWRKWALGIGLVDDPGRRKIHSTPIPLAGGWAVLFGIALPLILGAAAVFLGVVPIPGAAPMEEILRYGVSKRGAQSYLSPRM